MGLAQGQCSKWTRVSCRLDPSASGTACPFRAVLLELSLLTCRSFVSQDRRWFLPGCLWLKFLQWKEALDRSQGVNLVTSRGPDKPWGTVYTGQGGHVGRALGAGMTQPGSLGQEEEGRVDSPSSADARPAGSDPKHSLGPVFWIRVLQLRAEDAFRAWVLIPRCPGQVRQRWPLRAGRSGWLLVSKVENLSCVSSG